MICPRCGNERGAIAFTSPCPQCGFALYGNRKPEQSARPGSAQKNSPVYTDTSSFQSSSQLTNVAPKWGDMPPSRAQSGNLPVDSFSPLDTRGLPKTGPFERSQPQTGPFGRSEDRETPDAGSFETPDSTGLPGFKPFDKPDVTGLPGFRPFDKPSPVGLSGARPFERPAPRVRPTERPDVTGLPKADPLERTNGRGFSTMGRSERVTGAAPGTRSPSGRLIESRRPSSNLSSSGTPRPVRLTPSGPTSSQNAAANTEQSFQRRPALDMTGFGHTAANGSTFQSQRGQGMRAPGMNGREESSLNFGSAMPPLDHFASTATSRPTQSPPFEGFRQQSDIDNYQSMLNGNAPGGQQAAPPSSQRPLLPGILLRGGRYRLQELVERQDWMAGVFEAIWIGRDSQHGGAQVMICEVVVPDNASVMTQSMLRSATMALASVGRHPHITTLWDAFSDVGRSFFVFELVDGQSLMARLRHLRHPLSEQEVVGLCLQVSEILELLTHQSPALVHGLIRPEHIYISRTGNQYVLGNFSTLLAGGAVQFITGMDRAHLSPYSAPEFNRGMIDVRCDLYSLMATAYHAVTGSAPVMTGGMIQRAQRLNPAISDELDAILAKGLRAMPNQRYQHPGELRHDLLALRSVSGSLVPNGDLAAAFAGASPSMNTSMPFNNPPAAEAVQPFPLQFTSLAVDGDESAVLLPSPEDLPPMREGNDRVGAALMLAVVLVGLTAVTALSHFHM